MRGLGVMCLALAGCGGFRDVSSKEASPARVAGWASESWGGLTSEVYTPAFMPPSSGGRGAMIVLHGCAQTANDLKTRADWSSISETFGIAVIIPKVPGGGKYAGCWDYYGSNHTRSNRDNNDILALVDAIVAAPGMEVDPNQVYIAGLSSGAGEAMVMACLAPDVFAGVGIAAGPSVGTSVSGFTSVSTNAAAAKSLCKSLAGSHADAFDTQLAAAHAGLSDYVVAQGYSDLNVQVFSEIYAETAGTLTPYAFSVDTLEGYQPRGTGVESSDGEGPRVSLIKSEGMGHAWPGGTGSGFEMGFVAAKGLDYGWYLAEFFSRNNRRADAFVPGDLPEDPVDPEDPVEDPEDPEDPVEDPEDPVEDPEDPECPPYVASATDDINGHLSRYDVYPLGYGVVDETYVNLIDEHGVFGEFTLYQAASGDWYSDPAAMPTVDCP
jgi:poly(3-hydroxybutyrate) depolymerase